MGEILNVFVTSVRKCSYLMLNKCSTVSKSLLSGGSSFLYGRVFSKFIVITKFFSFSLPCCRGLLW